MGRGCEADPLTQRADTFARVLAGVLAPHPATGAGTRPRAATSADTAGDSSDSDSPDAQSTDSARRGCPAAGKPTASWPTTWRG